MVVVVFLIGFTLTNEALAMRCSGKIIDVGTTSYKLLKHCGEPVAVLRDDWGSKVTYIYEKNGRTQYIVVVDGIVKGGV
jgi:hypothetical protein